jgi:hypothetical protein
VPTLFKYLRLSTRSATRKRHCSTRGPENSGAIRFQDASQTTRLHGTLYPVIQSRSLDRGWVVAFLPHEHFPNFVFVALNQHFRDVRDCKEGQVPTPTSLLTVLCSDIFLNEHLAERQTSNTFSA